MSFGFKLNSRQWQVFSCSTFENQTLEHNNRQAFFIGTNYCASYTDTLDYKVDIDFFYLFFCPPPSINLELVVHIGTQE